MKHRRSELILERYLLVRGPLQDFIVPAGFLSLAYTVIYIEESQL